jgi:MerR family redox-sensitive transcriptional activator SoxR
MKIGDVAKRAGIRPSAVRHYERIGLLRPVARVSGRRQFGSGVVDRLAFIQIGVRLGFSLDELRETLGAVGRNDLRVNKKLRASARRMMERKIGELDHLIADATNIRAVLSEAMRCECVDLSACVIVRESAKLPREGPVSARFRK